MSCGVCKDGNPIVIIHMVINGKEKSFEQKIDCNFCPECGRSLTLPKPLTLDQLREMDGEPVYILMGDGKQFWAVVAIENEYVCLCCPEYDGDCPDTDFYAMYYDDPDGHFGLHVLGWVAYVHKPSGTNKK